MTPLTVEAAVLAYLGREGEATADTIAEATKYHPHLVHVLLNFECRDLVLSRRPRTPTETCYRLSAKGRRLLAKHRAAVAAAYGQEE